MRIDLPEDYQGKCKLECSSRSGMAFEAVFPSAAEASGAAEYAFDELRGGFNNVRVTPAGEESTVTHQTAVDWALDDDS